MVYQHRKAGIFLWNDDIKQILLVLPQDRHQQLVTNVQVVQASSLQVATRSLVP